MDKMTYEDICKYVGKMFLEMRHELEVISKQAAQILKDLQSNDNKNEK